MPTTIREQRLLEYYNWQCLTKAALIDDLALALLLAKTAAEISLTYYRQTELEIHTKPDLTPVTIADQEVEKQLRKLIASYRPIDIVLGEEEGFGDSPANKEESLRKWIIDPIDGTKNFIRNVPIWASLIALEISGELNVSVITAPAINSLWWAKKGMGSFTFYPDDSIHQIQTSKISELADASLGISSDEYWGENIRKLRNISTKVWRIRGYGDFYIFCLLAEGALDIALEPEVNVWDLAAPALIVTEAGGKFTNFLGLPGPYGGQALATNAALFEKVCAELAQ